MRHHHASAAHVTHEDAQQTQQHHSEQDNRHDQTGHGSHETSPLVLDAELLHELGGRIATAEAGVIRQQVSLPGEVQLNREAVAHITPRFPAKIIAVRAETGDTVQAGEILAVAESSETLARFELKSLIDGVIIQRHITLGEHLTPEDAAFVVANLSTLWVDIALYPKQIPLVEVGQPVRVHSRHGPDPVNAHINYVAPLVDERTRTGLARVFLSNERGRWRPGMFIEADITLAELAVPVTVPKTAVISVEGQPTVFVQKRGLWEPRAITRGREDSGSIEVLKGLHAGERYLAEGGFVLKAQLQKSDFESGHSH